MTRLVDIIILSTEKLEANSSPDFLNLDIWKI